MEHDIIDVPLVSIFMIALITHMLSKNLPVSEFHMFSASAGCTVCVKWYTKMVSNSAGSNSA